MGKAGAGAPGAGVRPCGGCRGGWGRIVRADQAPVAPHAAGPLGRWAAGPLGRWAAGPLGRWAAGPLGRWAAGPLGRWAAGPLGRWAAGPLGRWAAGPLGRWAAGPLGRWAAGPLGRWAAGPLGRWALYTREADAGVKCDRASRANRPGPEGAAVSGTVPDVPCTATSEEAIPDTRNMANPPQTTIPARGSCRLRSPAGSAARRREPPADASIVRVVYDRISGSGNRDRMRSGFIA